MIVIVLLIYFGQNMWNLMYTELQWIAKDLSAISSWFFHPQPKHPEMNGSNFWTQSL